MSSARAVADAFRQVIEEAAAVLDEYGERACRLMNLVVFRGVCARHSVSI
jgi:hypothetical protein